MKPFNRHGNAERYMTSQASFARYYL